MRGLSKYCVQTSDLVLDRNMPNMRRIAISRISARFGLSIQELGLIEMSPHDSTVAALEWDPASPHDAAEWFANVSVPWWITGGWAIALFLNRSTRAHKDLDVGVLRRDVGAGSARYRNGKCLKQRTVR